MNVVRLRSRDNIRDLMDGWARWRVGKISAGLGWPHKTMTGRLLDGMPSTKCTTCNGRGYVTERDIHSIRGRIDCPVCAGEGKVKADPRGLKVNPALIRSTAPYYSPMDNPLFVRIDGAVSAFRLDDKRRSLFFVVWYEYTRNGTQQTKADRLHISQGYYSKLLDQALTEIDLQLEE